MLLKIVQLMMASAIFNPFCCCTAGVLSWDDIEQAPAVHSCCQSAADLPQDDSNQNHDPAECPHAALKDYEVTSEKGAAAADAHASLLPVLLALFDFRVVEPTVQTQFPVSVATVSHAPPLPFAQVYCIYRV